MTTVSQAPVRDAGFWKRVLICVIIGFSSGLPLFVFLNLIPAWADGYGLDIKTIGLLTLLQVPYVGKPLWAPFLDWFSLPRVGRRRTWMLSQSPALASTPTAAASKRVPAGSSTLPAL